MGMSASLFDLKSRILKQNAHKFRLLRHNNIVNGKRTISFDIQKKKKFLIFEWWSTVNTGYNNLRQARHAAFDLIIEESNSKKD